MKNLAVIVLAAGEGTRMKSRTQKVLHPMLGRPLIEHVLRAAGALSPQKIVVVAGRGRQDLEKALTERGWKSRVRFATQAERRGTGHAALQAKAALGSFRGDALVLCGDAPLIRPETLSALVRDHRLGKRACTVLTSLVNDPKGYGRVVRNTAGGVEKIVEELDASSSEREIREINSGAYCFRLGEFWRVLRRLKPQNKKGEYYLTDVLSLLIQDGQSVGAWTSDDPDEIRGINDRRELAELTQVQRQRVLRRLMSQGVTVWDPSSVWVEDTVTVGEDTELLPGTILLGSSRIGGGCRIGPNALIESSVIGSNSTVRYSRVAESFLGSDVQVGPFSHLRPGTHLESGTHVGNFSEVKKSRIGRFSKVNHLSYIGDSTLGEHVNVGAGTITCNYDGKKKHQTVIGDGAFVGSNVNFVAPVRVGRKALIGAGSTITEDVPAGALAIARARQTNKKRKV